MYCLRGTGTLSKLLALRRPVIVRLTEGPREAWGVLLGIGREKARLALAGTTFETAREDLEQAWSGEYWAVWRAPTLADGTLRRGDAGGAVDWVRERLLDTGDATFDTMGPAYYDLAMEAGVRRLQAAHGLVPDGIVGPETLFALDARDDEGPRLRRSLP